MIEVAKASGVVNILSDRLTVPYIIERVSKGFATPIQTSQGSGLLGLDYSVLIFSTEVPVLLGDPEELKYWSDLWDSRESPYEYGTRGGGLLVIPKTNFNLLCGGTPSNIGMAIPPANVSGGFTRRIVFVYSPARHQDLPWPHMMPPVDDLVEDLQYIATHIRGEFTFEEKAKPLFESVYMDSKPKDVEEEFIAHFRSTKWVHAVKLSMALSASRGDDRVITLLDLQTAVDEVQHVEDDLPKVFSRFAGSNDQALLGQLILEYIDQKGYASKQEIGKVLWRHIRSIDDLNRLITAMCEFGIIIEVNRGHNFMYKRTGKGLTPNP